MKTKLCSLEDWVIYINILPFVSMLCLQSVVVVFE